MSECTDMDGHGFDFTANMRHVVQAMVDRLAELSHIDLERVAFSFGQARKRTRHGIYASLTPMRFRDGKLTTQRRGEPYTVQRLYNKSGQEMLYILTFYLPRFMDVDLNEKLVTILHELWHISPHFDGDLRRHPGRCYVHSHSQAEYDAKMQVLATDGSAHSRRRTSTTFCISRLPSCIAASVVSTERAFRTRS